MGRTQTGRSVYIVENGVARRQASEPAASIQRAVQPLKSRLERSWELKPRESSPVKDLKTVAAANPNER